MNIQNYLKQRSSIIEKALKSHLPRLNGATELEKAMCYSVLSGGKRIRPALVLAGCEAVGGRIEKALPAACAVEFIHSYSLIHDDLPCMDNDNERRGKPTTHVEYGEATALLAGDALLTLAFQVLSLSGDAKSVQVLSRAAGMQGMVGGQAADMEYQKKEKSLPMLEFIHTHKTGALIAASLELGGLAGGARAKQMQSLTRYGRSIGLLFQIVDDILDGEGYAKVLGVSEAKKQAENLTKKAKKEAGYLGPKAKPLSLIADFLLTREM